MYISNLIFFRDFERTKARQMDDDTLKALRVVVNESTTKHIKELQKDSDELSQLKKQLPLLSQLLALGDKDINNHQTGKLLLHDEDTYAEYTMRHPLSDLLFMKKRPTPKGDEYIFRLTSTTGNEHINFLDEYTDSREVCVYRLDEMLKKKTISFNCCPKYGCDGDASYCCFDSGPHTYTCGLYYVAEGNQYCDEDGDILSEYATYDEDDQPIYDVLGFDLIWHSHEGHIWKSNPSLPITREAVIRDLKEVQCKRCGKVLPEADIKDHIYNYEHPIWKCPHE